MKATPLVAIVGAVVAQLRKEQNLTQADLAHLAGMHPISVSKIERGVQGDVGVATMEKLGAVFGLKASQLMARVADWQRALKDIPDSGLRGLALAASEALHQARSNHGGKPHV